MKVYGTTDFTGHYPVGTAAVVTANSEQGACDILNAELVKRGLPGDAAPSAMFQIRTGKMHRTVCWIMNDGDY